MLKKVPFQVRSIKTFNQLVIKNFADNCIFNNKIRRYYTSYVCYF